MTTGAPVAVDLDSSPRAGLPEELDSTAVRGSLSPPFGRDSLDLLTAVAHVDRSTLKARRGRPPMSTAISPSLRTPRSRPQTDYAQLLKSVQQAGLMKRRYGYYASRSG